LPKSETKVIKDASSTSPFNNIFRKKQLINDNELSSILNIAFEFALISSKVTLKKLYADCPPKKLLLNELNKLSFFN